MCWWVFGDIFVKNGHVYVVQVFYEFILNKYIKQQRKDPTIINIFTINARLIKTLEM